MSRSATKQRRSDDEFKPSSSSKKAKHAKPTETPEHQSVQRIRLIDLIKNNYLCAGDVVFVKDQEGIITQNGTIKVGITGSSGTYIEYSNPTSWTKIVTGRENGGWGQIRLKSSKQTLAAIKELYQKNMSIDFVDDSGEAKPIAFPHDAINAASSTPTETNLSDISLPLKVRFINDEDRVFKIIWVSSDFKEFHTEYQGTLYYNLPDFVNKILEDFQKPSNDPNAPSPGTLRFDELMYELHGKWVRLSGNPFFPSDFMNSVQQGNHADQVTYQQSLSQTSPHIQSLNFSNTNNDNCNHRANNHTNNNCNNSNNASGEAANMTSDSVSANNTSYDEYNQNHAMAEADDDDEDDDEYYQNNDQRRRRVTLSKNPFTAKRPNCYKCLVFVEDSVFPLRVNSFGPTTVKDVLHTVLLECNLSHNNTTEADLLRDYNVEIEDYDFGGVKVIFPRSINSFPTKSKIYVRRKEPSVVDAMDIKQETSETQLEDKENTTNENMLNDKYPQPQPQALGKEDDA